MIATKPTQDKMLKTVYCLYRVSTKGQVDKNDIPMQRQSCREFAEHQPGWVIKWTIVNKVDRKNRKIK